MSTHTPIVLNWANLKSRNFVFYYFKNQFLLGSANRDCIPFMFLRFHRRYFSDTLLPIPTVA